MGVADTILTNTQEEEEDDGGGGGFGLQVNQLKCRRMLAMTHDF
jgi:hypothetical protein